MTKARVRSFKQVDVFTQHAFVGNPVAVVLDAEGLSGDQMLQIARWTNLSETTFVLPPEDPEADYKVRIFTPAAELPFAGHPTIGTCHAWLEAGGQPATSGAVVQECGVGLVRLRHHNGRLGFAAPALIRSGPVDEQDLAQVCEVLRVNRDKIVGAQWADNGPGWLAVELASAEEVLALEPDFGAVDAYDVGVVGPHPVGVVGKVGAFGVSSDDVGVAIEVRAFFRAGGVAAEDPVTGSLNASLAQWLLAEGKLTAPYIAAQGTAMGRAGRVYIDQDDNDIWVSGDAVTCIDGTISA